MVNNNNNNNQKNISISVKYVKWNYEKKNFLKKKKVREQQMYNNIYGAVMRNVIVCVCKVI